MINCNEIPIEVHALEAFTWLLWWLMTESSVVWHGVFQVYLSNYVTRACPLTIISTHSPRNWEPLWQPPNQLLLLVAIGLILLKEAKNLNLHDTVLKQHLNLVFPSFHMKVKALLLRNVILKLGMETSNLKFMNLIILNFQVTLSLPYHWKDVACPPVSEETSFFLLESLW